MPVHAAKGSLSIPQELRTTTTIPPPPLAMATSKKITQRLTRESFKQWLQGLDAFLFDCDGGALLV